MLVLVSKPPSKGRFHDFILVVFHRRSERRAVLGRRGSRPNLCHRQRLRIWNGLPRPAQHELQRQRWYGSRLPGQHALSRRGSADCDHARVYRDHDVVLRLQVAASVQHPYGLRRRLPLPATHPRHMLCLVRERQWRYRFVGRRYVELIGSWRWQRHRATPGRCRCWRDKHLRNHDVIPRHVPALEPDLHDGQRLPVPVDVQGRHDGGQPTHRYHHGCRRLDASADGHVDEHVGQSLPVTQRLGRRWRPRRHCSHDLPRRGRRRDHQRRKHASCHVRSGQHDRYPDFDRDCGQDWRWWLLGGEERFCLWGVACAARLARAAGSATQSAATPTVSVRSSICAPISTTRLGGMAKKSVAERALRDRKRKRYLRQSAMPFPPGLRIRVSRPR